MVKNSQPVYIYIVAFLSDKIAPRTVIQNLTDCLLTAGNKYSGKKRIQNVIHWVLFVHNVPKYSWNMKTNANVSKWNKHWWFCVLTKAILQPNIFHFLQKKPRKCQIHKLLQKLFSTSRRIKEAISHFKSTISSAIPATKPNTALPIVTPNDHPSLWCKSLILDP